MKVKDIKEMVENSTCYDGRVLIRFYDEYGLFIGSIDREDGDLFVSPNLSPRMENESRFSSLLTEYDLVEGEATVLKGEEK